MPNVTSTVVATLTVECLTAIFIAESQLAMLSKALLRSLFSLFPLFPAPLVQQTKTLSWSTGPVALYQRLQGRLCISLTLATFRFIVHVSPGHIGARCYNYYPASVRQVSSSEIACFGPAAGTPLHLTFGPAEKKRHALQITLDFSRVSNASLPSLNSVV